jgi:integrase
MAPKRERTDHPDIVAYPNKDRYARIRIRGVRREISLGTKNQREAKDRLKLLFRELDPDSFVKGEIRVDDIFKRFMEDIGRDKRDRTREEYDRLFSKHLLPFFKFIPLREINKDLWEKYSKTKSINLKNHRKVFGRFLRWCMDEKYITGVPSLPIPKYKVKKGHALSEEQLQALLAQCRTPKLLLFCLMYLHMAMRSREITALPWSRVHLDKRVIYLDEDATKTKGARWVPMHDQVFKLLSLMKEKSKSPYVFPMRGKPSTPTCNTGIYKSFNSAKERAGIDFDISPHDFRHTWNTEAHMDPSFTDAQREEFAGSHSLVQKGIYVHLKVERLRPLTQVIKHESVNSLVENKLENWGKSGGKSK